MAEWTRPSFTGHPGNRILSVISVMEIPPNFAPGAHVWNSMKPAKSYSSPFRDLSRERLSVCPLSLPWDKWSNPYGSLWFNDADFEDYWLAVRNSGAIIRG